MLKASASPARDAQTILGPSNVAVTLGVYREVFDTEIATVLDESTTPWAGRPEREPNREGHASKRRGDDPIDGDSSAGGR